MPRAALVPDCDYDLFFSYAIEDDDERLQPRRNTLGNLLPQVPSLRAIDRKVGRRDSIKVFLDRLELESSNAQLSPALKDNLDKTAVFIAIVSTSYLHPESRCNLERKYFLASLGDAPEKHAGRVWIILIEEMPSVRWREAFFPDLRATVFYEKDVDDRVRLPMPGTDAKVDQRFLDRIEDLAQGIALSLKELMIRPPAPSRFTSHALTTPINPSRPQVSSKPLRRPLRAFLCHSSHDKMAVRELYQKLIHDDFFVWFDEENLLPGQQWDTEIRKAVRESDVVVACLSRSSITKEGYVQKEIRYALDVAAEKPEGTIFLFPARLDECDVPPGLQALQWVDLYNDKGYERLLKALRKRGEEFGLSVPAMDNLPLAVRGEERVDNAGLNQLQITSWSELPPKSKPEVFVSYAWGDDSSDDARKRTEIVDRLCETLGKEGWNILRYSEVLRPGELISGFMKRIGLADHVIVVLSDKYLRSPYCMTELHSIYQRSVGEKEDFLRRIIPLRLDDARFNTWRDRVIHAQYWEKEFKAMEQHLTYIGPEDFRLYKAMKDWHYQVSEMLAYVNDVLHPHGFHEIVKDDFAALRQMLQRQR